MISSTVTWTKFLFTVYIMVNRYFFLMKYFIKSLLTPDVFPKEIAATFHNCSPKRAPSQPGGCK